jgi:hypothetical protein
MQAAGTPFLETLTQAVQLELILALEPIAAEEILQVEGGQPATTIKVVQRLVEEGHQV